MPADESISNVTATDQSLLDCDQKFFPNVTDGMLIESVQTEEEALSGSELVIAETTQTGKKCGWRVSMGRKKRSNVAKLALSRKRGTEQKLPRATTNKREKRADASKIDDSNSLQAESFNSNDEGDLKPEVQNISSRPRRTKRKVVQRDTPDRSPVRLRLRRKPQKVTIPSLAEDTKKPTRGRKYAKDGRQTATDETSDAVAKKSPAQPRKRSSKPQPPLLRCTLCPDFKTRSETRYEIHQADHDPTIPIFKCTVCEKKFLSEALLDRHMAGHTGAWYRCQHCPYTTNEKSRHQVHQARHDPTVVVIRCTFCPKKFVDHASLGRHKCVQMSGANLHRCSQCDFTTPRKARFEIHQAKHDPSIVIYRCVCDRPFLNAESMKSHHCRLGGPDAEMFRCPHCAYVNKFRHQLKYHVLAMHRPGEKPFKCPEAGCSYATGRKKDVGRHYKTAHLNIRPFVCETCGHRSVSRSKLVAHSRTHTREKPYKCDTCQQAFSDSTSMKRHRERHLTKDRAFVWQNL